MEKLIIFADLHFNSPGNHAWPEGKASLEFGDSVVHAGDLWELKNIPKRKVNELRKEYSDYIVRCKATNTITAACNHGVSVARFLNGEYEIVKTFNHVRILVCHGHRLYWDDKDCDEWEGKKPGKGWWKLRWIASKNGHYKESKEKRPPQRVIDECVRLCRLHNCTTCIFGHSHSYCDIMEQGIRIINVARGRTEVLI